MHVGNIYSTIVAVVSLLVFGTPVYAAKIDIGIESSARKSYVFMTFLSGDSIRIRSRNGAVTLTGDVTYSFHKSLAQDTVAVLPGVKSVDNRLEVKGGSPATNSDHWLRDQVKVALMFHRSIDAATTEISAEDGVVTLRGSAASNAQIQVTTEYAMDVEGVTEVNNEMTVNTSPLPPKVDETVDDASINSQVKMAMRYHRSTNSLLTKIKTKRGVVTLHGKGSDIAELAQATKLVSDVYGVKRVVNRMAIE